MLAHAEEMAKPRLDTGRERVMDIGCSSGRAWASTYDCYEFMLPHLEHLRARYVCSCVLRVRGERSSDRSLPSLGFCRRSTADRAKSCRLDSANKVSGCFSTPLRDGGDSSDPRWTMFAVSSRNADVVNA